MARDKLTDLKVRSFNKLGRYGDGSGLWLQVRGSKNKSWLFRYTLDGRQRQMGLGSYPDVALAAARLAATAARQAVFAGEDPIAAKRAQRSARSAAAALTFRAVAEMYVTAHEPTWRNQKHRWQWRATLENHVYPVFGDWQVKTIDTGAVMKVLEPIWHTKPETAARVRGRIETVLDYASARAWRNGDNPARWRGHIANLLPARAKVAQVRHHAALPWKEVGAFMALVGCQAGTAAVALRFTIMTAARTSEAIEARWKEIDLQAAVWTVPADRTKAAREHRVPLATAVIHLLSAIQPARASPEAYLFPGPKPKAPLSNMAMTALMRRIGRTDLTVHGFRSTFRDWAGEATNYPRELAEAALAHVLKSKTEAAYARGDALEKRRRLMEDWGAFCTKPAPINASVVPIREAR